MRQLVLAFFALPFLAPFAPAGDAKIRVACVGDSITELSNYPGMLQKMLAADEELAKENKAGYDVKNFGVSGSTLLSKSDRPYVKQKKYEAALAFKPNIVILMLGTNDTRKVGPNTYQHIDEFVPDAKKLIGAFQALETKPKIYLCLPVPIYGQGNFNLTNENLVAGVIPAVKKAADETKVTLVDMNAALSNHPEWFPDRIHPNADGARAIAATAFKAITGREPAGKK